MFMTNLKKKVSILLLIGSISFITVGCGGGGGGGGTVETPKEMVTITKDNAEKVIGGTVESIGAALDLEDGSLIPMTNTVSDNIAESATKFNRLGNIASANLEPGTLAESGTESCSGGGSVSYNGDENTGGTVKFDQCVEQGITINGSMDIRINGADTTTTLTNFSVKGSTSTPTGSYSFEVFYSNATVHLNTSTYDMSLTATGYSIENGKKFEFENYRMTKTGNKYTFNGLIKSDCIGGWVEIKTNTPLVMDQDCPTAGEIVTIGNNSEMKTVFNSDKSVDVTLNGEKIEHYQTCDEMPEGCN